MINLTGYHFFERTVLSHRSQIYRGIRLKDQRPVIIKTHGQEYPSNYEINRFLREYEIGRKFRHQNIVRYLGIERHVRGLALIEEDCGAIGLAEHIPKNGFTPDLFIKLALQLVEGLGVIHQSGVIHKDIKPRNLIIELQSQVVKFIDFGLSTYLKQETKQLASPRNIEGTLLYMSPEQTGRMNRSLDYRTDYYSLGATFYKMLTGTTPYSSDDPLELLHYKIAKIPDPPHALRPGLPEEISQIIMKLLAKNAEDRYQSAAGLKADLEQCLDLLNHPGNIEAFRPGAEDHYDHFRIPQKLYGRGTEKKQIMELFQRVSNGKVELLLVAGFSGVGKTSLVNEIHKPVTKKRGYFISGKFDQLGRNTAYSAIIQAFQSFVNQILGESDQETQGWRDRILAAAGNNGRILIDVIPDMELLLGQQPAVPKLGPTETQNRFNLVFRNFVNVLATREHPLVLFLDDLQWVDSGSLHLLDQIVTDQDMGYLFVIGAYRDNEVDTAHPLLHSLDDMRKNGLSAHTLNLAPLDYEAIVQLLEDSFNRRDQALSGFARLIRKKTEGNPFFMNQFLLTLYGEGLLEYNSRSKHWEWELSKIKAKGYTDNVVELMVSKLSKLPKKTQHILRYAACFGARFQIRTLAIVYDSSPKECDRLLWSAVKEGFLIPIDTFGDSEKMESAEAEESISAKIPYESYRFLHDRVQQAAYRLISGQEKKKLHVKIGRLLLENTPEEDLEEGIFEIADHLNIGLELIEDPKQRIKLAELNLQAGIKGKLSTAYHIALNYFNVGISLLPDNCWKTFYPTARDLHLNKAECKYLVNDFKEADRCFTRVLSMVKTNIEKASIYNLLIKLCFHMSDPLKSIELGRKGLNILGFELPREAEAIKSAIKKETDEINVALSEQGIEELLNLPELHDSEKRLATELGMQIIPSAYTSGNINLMILLQATMVNLSIKSGNTNFSSYVYSQYAVNFAVSGDYDTAFRWGKLGLKLNQKHQNVALSPWNNFLNACFLNHWKRPARTSEELFRKAFSQGLELGDLVIASYAAIHLIYFLHFLGKNLDFVYQEALKKWPFTKRTKFQTGIDDYLLTMLLILNLKGKTKTKHGLGTDDYDEVSLEKRIRKNDNVQVLMFYLLSKLKIAYFYEDFQTGFSYIEEAFTIKESVIGMVLYVDFYFFSSLTLGALYFRSPGQERKKYLKILRKNHSLIKRWSESCPENFRYMERLISGEIARIENRITQAMECYDQAIQSAREQEFFQNEAIANEVAARFYLSLGRRKIASLYLTEAWQGYRGWGASAKVKDLEKKYPDLLSSQQPQPPSALELTESVIPGQLDLETIFKTSQAISSEINLDRLLIKLMKIIVENAGAQRGVILLERNGELLVEASLKLDSEEVNVLQRLPLVNSDNLPQTIIRQVFRTGKNMVLGNAFEAETCNHDDYIRKKKPQSVLCSPIHYKGHRSGVLYLENNLATNVFTKERIGLLDVLLSQAAISLENARLFEERVRAEEELKSAYERFRTVMDSLDALVYVADMDTHEMLFVNEYGRKIWGDIKGKVCWQSLQTAPCIFCTNDKLLDTRGNPTGVYQWEFQNTIDKEWYDCRDQAITWIDGRYVRMEIATNITERKLAEQELRESGKEKEKLVQEIRKTNKEMESFVYTVSHDLKSPLISIQGFSSLLLKKEKGMDKDSAFFLKRIIKNTDIMEDLITRLLQLSRIGRIKEE